MSVVRIPEMSGYTPKMLNGMFTAQVTDVKLSTGGKGYTFYLELTSASEACQDQPWQGVKVTYWVGTDLSQAPPQMRNKWMNKIYLLAEAFKMPADEFDPEDCIGKDIGVNIRSVKKNGAINTNVEGVVTL